ncbi:MAG: hypothetical protein M1327_00975 [Candidatus Thermoplasmatota archaeon]|nr:hypothetical protein [Candidatus Thermoplasmatota archaeon]
MVTMILQKYIAIFSVLVMLTAIAALVSGTGQPLHNINSSGEGMQDQVTGSYASMIASNIPSPVIPAGVLNYTSFHIVNNQNLSTPVPFDLEAKVNSAALSKYEAAGLQNVEWFWSNGVTIPSWIQSGANSSSVCTVYWLRLNFSIPANSNSSIYMGFESTSTDLMSGYNGNQGEAPQLSPSYGEFDNGKNVFAFYCNFSGLPFQSNWLTFQQATANVTVDHGLIIKDSFNDAYAYAITKRPVLEPEIIEAFVTEDNVTAGYPSTEGIGISTSHNLTNRLVYDGTPYDYYFEGGFEADLFHDQNQAKNSMSPSVNMTQVSQYVNFTFSPFMLGIGLSGNSTQYWYINGNTVAETHNNSIHSDSYFPNIGMTSGGSGAGLLKIQYVRGIYMPPNNVMPAVSGKYIVNNPGYVYITLSGIPSYNTWYLNISGISGIVEHGTLSINITLPFGLYYYNVSSYYRGSDMHGYGLFQVQNGSGTYVLIVFTPTSPVITPTQPAPPYPPEFYAMIAEIVVLVSGAVLIMLTWFRKHRED